MKKYSKACIFWGAIMLGPPGLAVNAAASTTAGAELASVGDPAMAALVDALFNDYSAVVPVKKASIWDHTSDSLAIGALMFERADIAPIMRAFTPAELAPYKHQFRGDMMSAPLSVTIATTEEGSAMLAVNLRPGAPLEPKVGGFLAYALSARGQSVVASVPGFRRLASAHAARERQKLEFALPILAPPLPDYRAPAGLSGEISSVGSDGMKALIDRWQRQFHDVHPQVTRGEQWEHIGTLNGFHALLHDVADLAPMGRELWPEELAAWQSVFGAGTAPLEMRVARGGFNTPQRTTAQGIFVSEDNPIETISIEQLAAVFGKDPTITKWGQLGLTGKWADRPISRYVPPLVAPNAMSMQKIVLGGRVWDDALTQGTIAQTEERIAADPGAIGFGGFEEAPSLKSLAVIPIGGKAAVRANMESVANGRYPLTRYMYIRLQSETAKRPEINAFLRYILSRHAQDDVRWSAYFPLNADEAREELAKLDALTIKSAGSR